MPKALPQSKRDPIKTLLEEGIPHATIADEINISIQTIKNYSTNLKHHDTVLLPGISKLGRPPILTREMVEVQIPEAQSKHTIFSNYVRDTGNQKFGQYSSYS